MAGLLVLLLFALVLIFVALVVVRLAIRHRSGIQTDMPGCGRCGYPTRGISELKCPECGADLKEVGIVKPGDGRSILAGCLMPLLVTIVTFVLALGGYALVHLVLPTYREQSTHFDLWPESQAYSQVTFYTDLTIIIPASERNQVSGLSFGLVPGVPPTTTVDLCGANAKAEVEMIALEVMPNKPNAAGINYPAPKFRVDPQTRLATWLDDQSNLQASNGPVTEKDVLAYLADYGADISQPGVVLEAQQLTAAINALIKGSTQFTIKGFQNGGYGSGSSGQLGPNWFTPAYFVAWLVIWIIALGILGQKSKKRARAETRTKY